MAWRGWFLGGAASLGTHGLALAGLGLMLEPKPVEQQPVPRSELTVSSYQVDQSEAAVQAPEADEAAEDTPSSPKLGEGAIKQSRAEPAELGTTRAGEADPATQRLGAHQQPGETLAAARPVGEVGVATDLDSETVALSAAATQVLSPALANIETSAEIEATAQTIAPTESAPENLAPVEQPSELVGAVQASGESLGAVVAPAPQLEAIANTAVSSAAVTPSSTRISQASVAPMRAEALSAAVPVIAALDANAEFSGTKLTSSAAPKETRIAALAKPGGAPLALAAMQGVYAAALPARGENSAELAKPGEPLESSAARGQQATPQDLPSEFATAALAWTGDEERVVDPLSLAAIQAFMQPSDIGQVGGEVRDGIESVLAAVPCARLQTVFEPESGRMHLRGHIPEDGLRGPILAALKEQIGEAIPIDDTLLVLPRPQCGALAGIANVGLPQSTDHITNPRVVGPEGFAQNYTYSEGQRLELELVAPDYPSVVYVDYFTADGMVLHLQPNEIVPLEAYPAEAGFSVGKERADGPALDITIGPPFGQEIAVAFATSVPVYEGLRPLSEPAEPYLAFLRAQVADLRARDPNFKGEWAYFFISTTPR